MEEPSTPESQSTTGHFRESDIEYLRAQAKEWLEAVLGEDLDEQTSLEDLLADGSLLYKVSQHIKDDSKYPGHVESSSHSMSASPSIDRRSSMKYQPYASVEEFLKVCKEVGLRDVDVFNPSDAVDKKDIRPVCVCLRRLSKKGRSLDIQVPDFDNVKDTLVTPASKMPRDAVRRTQESLQQSSSRSSSRSGANGLVSSETSSLIADLRKVDAESEKVESNVRHDLDVASEHREPIVTESKYTVKVAEPGVDTLPVAHHDEEDRTTKKAAPPVSIRSEEDSTHRPAPKKIELDSHIHTSQEHHSHDHVDRNGEEAASESSANYKDTHDAHAATEHVAKLPVKAPVEEKPQFKPFGGLVLDKPKEKLSEETRKGLFIAHLQGTEPYEEAKKEVEKEMEKDDESGVFPWLLPLLGGAVAIAGGIAGLLFVKKRSGNDDYSIKRLIGSGKAKVTRLRGSGDPSDGGSDSDDEGRVFSGGSYEVRRGDNLTVIAKKSGRKNWREIADKNGFIDNPDLIYPGERLKL